MAGNPFLRGLAKKANIELTNRGCVICLRTCDTMPSEDEANGDAVYDAGCEQITGSDGMEECLRSEKSTQRHLQVPT